MRRTYEFLTLISRFTLWYNYYSIELAGAMPTPFKENRHYGNLRRSGSPGPKPGRGCGEGGTSETPRGRREAEGETEGVQPEPREQGKAGCVLQAVQREDQAGP